MKKFNVDTSEAKRILQMHKSLMKEEVQQSIDPVEILNNFIDIGCLKGGSLRRDKKTGKIFYRKDLKSGNVARQFSDMTFTITNPNKKVIKTAKWNCDKYQAEIQTNLDTENQNNEEIQRLIAGGLWKTREQLGNVPIEDLNNEKLYQKHPKFELYKSVTDVNRPEQYTTEQKEVLARYAKRGFYPRGEFNAGTVTDSNCEDLSERYAGLFGPGKFEVCNRNNEVPEKHVSTNDVSTTTPVSTNTAAAGATAAGATAAVVSTEDKEVAKKITDYDWVVNQIKNKEPKGFCRELSKVYYNYWLDTTAGLTDDQFIEMKRLMQKCVDQHNFRKNIFRKSDNYVRIMTGNEPGQGPGPSPGKDGRVWLLTNRRR